MKRKRLLMLGISAALTLGTGITAWAAGWATENGKWVYYDNSGYRVTNDWKKGADDQWRYLNNNGEMAMDSWAEDSYYVDANGIMVSGKWLKLRSNYNGETEDEHWYYFMENGKAAMDTWKKINNKWYHFDSEGAMETGWIDDHMYYADENGALVGWHKLYPPEGEEEDRDDFFDDDGKVWYYFNSSGKKFVPDLSDGAEYGEKRIDGTYYCFNGNGVMQTGWVYMGTSVAETGTIEDYRFYDKGGKAVTGWYSAEPPSSLGGYENDVEWFYFSKSGVPKFGPASGTATTKDFLRIGNKTYLFNEKGNPVSGLQKVYINESKGEYTSYYFNEEDCTVEGGKMTIEEGDGSKTQFYFSTSGKGYTGVQNGYLYYMGKLQRAEDGSKYEVISVPNGNSHINYVVNNSGKIVKSTAGVKNSDGVKYATTTGGVLTKIDGESVSADAVFREAEEPVWE
ncbi:MAG: cell wall-binding protein [Hungatella sp.]|nr:cell wall-binding protein [Hungatella sp.]